MNDQECSKLGQVVSVRERNGATIEIRFCKHFQKGCTVEDHGIQVPGGPMNVCAGCPVRSVAKPISATAAEPVPLTWTERAKEFARVMANTAKTGLADDALIESRLAICQECPQFSGQGCKLCGCSVVREKNLLNKLAHITSVCPDKINPRW